MKKFVITLLTFCLVQISFSQSTKSIRVNNSVQGKSWSYSISEIDSITYDVYSQKQKIYVNGDCNEAILEDVDSISFSSDEAINVALSNDYIEKTTSYIFSNGIILAEKDDSFQGKILIVDSLDVTKSQWSEDKSFMIYCNSSYKPLIAKNSQFIFYFEYDVNENLKEINATDLEGNAVYPVNANARKNAVRRVSTEGWTTGDDISAALDLYGTVNTLYNPTKGNIAGTVASWLAKLLPAGIPQDIGGLLPSLYEALQGGKAGILGSILGYEKLIQDIGENRARSLIGDCTPYIKSAYKEGNNSAIINVQIAGVSSSTQCTPYYLIRYWQEVNGEKTNVTYTTTPVKATNGTHPIKIDNLNGGRYGFQVLIFPNLFLEHRNLIGLYNFRSNIAYVDIARLYFKILEQDYITYADNYVRVSMKAVLESPSEQDEVILSYYDSYGVYYHYDDHVNQREDYISVKENGSKEFYITFDIPREDFSCDYNNFVATCANKITFKTYTIDGWGIKEFYDEQEPQIIYDQKPSLTFTSASLDGTEVYNDDDGEPYYCSTHVIAEYTAKGTFWVNKADLVVIQGNAEDNVGYWDVMNDGDQTFAAYYNYPYGGDHLCAFRFDFVLSNGNRVSSTNAVQISGSPIVTNISIISANAPAAEPSNAPAMKSYGKLEFKPIFVMKKE